jgi:hypothetical protein
MKEFSYERTIAEVLEDAGIGRSGMCHFRMVVSGISGAHYLSGNVPDVSV